MVGEDEWGQYPTPSSTQPQQKKFWRSSSWSPSRSSSHNPEGGEEKDGGDVSGNLGSNGSQARKFPLPLTPRSQQNSKARSSFPLLQPLSIARRSLDEWPRAGSDDIGEWPGPPTPGGRDVGERLKLDLSVIQRSSDKNAGLVRKDKIAFFDKECSKVAEHIYLGGDAVARDMCILKQNGITHVLNCVGFVCPEYFKADFVYRTLWLQDNPSEDITSILYDVFDYFEDVREQKGRVLVHCCQGVSRSTSLVIAYLMWREGQSFDDAFQYVKEARCIADPNMGFACQLLQCQKRVHAFPLSPSSSLRMYRMAPHSPYDPLHLVPKMLNDSSPSALDSRGTFIIHVPSAIYVWIGKNCEVIMERDAREAVCQIVRYEKVQVPVHVIREGEEQRFFWDAFSDFSLDKSRNGGAHGMASSKILPGERKVDQYDVDFEIFQKAIMGGFLPPSSSSETEHETHLPARENSWSVLRRKFTIGHMKDFVSAPKFGSDKLYLDSRMNTARDTLTIRPSLPHDLHLMSSVLVSLPSSPLSTLSSSSFVSTTSSPYLSPESFASDSSNSSKYSSESPLESPLTLTSNLSNLSFLSSDSSVNISSHPGYIEVNFPSRRSQQTSSSKNSPLSIAERRGNSMSKFLKLPIMSEDARTGDTKTNSGCLHNDSNLNKIFPMSETCDGESAADCNCSSIGGSGYSKESASSMSASEPFQEESSSAINVGKIGEINSSSRCSERDVLVGVMQMAPQFSTDKRPSVYGFPNLEKVLTAQTWDLDSKSAFVFVLPREEGTGINEVWNLYLWIGRSFDSSGNVNQTNRGYICDIDYSDRNQLRSYILSNIGFKEDTEIKIVQEGEEPADFLAILSTL